MGWFNREFIKAKKIDKKYSTIYRWAFNNRQAGDYDDFVIFSKDEVKIQFQEMMEFIQHVKKMLGIN